MIFNKGIWLPDNETEKAFTKNYEIKSYKKLNLSGDMCLDIGAHVGIWSQRLSKDYNEVICFEPLKKHIECHKKNCEGLKNITLHECALSNKNEYRQITTKDRNSGMTTLEPNISNRWSSKTKKVELVKTKILDDFNFGKIDFIKLDVEGHEISVLNGAKETIKKYYPKIFIEVWDKHYTKVSEVIFNMGYTMNKIDGRGNYFCEKLDSLDKQ